VAELAKRIIDLTGSHSEIVFLVLPSDDPRQRQPDIRLAREMFSWEPLIGIDEGLGRTIEYFRGEQDPMLKGKISNLAEVQPYIQKLQRAT
jgi:nucleoside-diphosphate-sugar epimerase